MVIGVYAVLDRLAEESGPLFTAPTVAVAVRNYRNLMEGSNVGRPDEYKLLHLGNYDTNRSLIESFAVPVDVTPVMASVEVKE